MLELFGLVDQVLIAEQASQGLRMQRLDVELDCFALHPTVSALDSVVSAPLF